MNLDIVIVNYKSTGHLIKCIDSIYKNIERKNAIIFVEDNGSDDGVERIMELFPEVVLTKNRFNLGFAKAVNKAIRKGRALYIVILNPDTVMFDGFFDSVISYMENNPDVGVLGPKILNNDGTVQGSARRFPTPLTGLFGRNSLLTRFFPNNPFTRANILTSRSDGRNPMQVDWVSGACMVVRRKSIEDVGLLDERFFMYWEDADWCRRMRQGGWKVIYLPTASIIHYVGVSSDRLLFRSILEFHKSSYRLFQKYAGKKAGLFGPLVLVGLFLRFIFVLLSNAIRIFRAGAYGKRALAQAAIAHHPERKIRVLRVIARLNIGGPAIHVHLLTSCLNKKLFHTVLVTGDVPPQEGNMDYIFEDQDTKEIRIPEMQREINLKNDVIAIFHVIRLLFSERPEIVHTHTSKAGTIGRVAVFLYNLVASNKALTVHTFHGNVFEGYFSPIKSKVFALAERLLAYGTDAIIAISGSQRKELSDKYRIAPARKIKVIPLGFDLAPFFSAGNLREGFKKKIGVDSSSFLVGIVGRLVPIKNHHMFFLAARKFLKGHPGSPIKFVVVGDGELRAQLEPICREQGIADFVCFSGWQKDIVAVYADLDILALTSLNEGTPVSIIEAMASSVPVIATDVGGVRDLLGRQCYRDSGGFTICDRGILCKKGDVAGFANGMRYMWNEAAVERQERLVRGRNFVAQQFSKDRLLENMEGLYLELVNRKKRGLFQVVENERLSDSAPLRVMR